MDNETKIYRVIAASGVRQLDADLNRFDNIEVCGVCNMRSDIPILLKDTAEKGALPDCVILSDNIFGEEELIELMLTEHNNYPDVRFIYLAGELDSKDTSRQDQLGTLVMNGIYDIVIGKVNPHLVYDLILFPKMRESVNYLTKHLLSTKQTVRNAAGGFEYEGFAEEEAQAVNQNLFMVWSPKPGSGKSFVSANLAVAVAKYGITKPRVALIDGDLQNLSIGNILGIKQDDKKNLRTAMVAITELLNDTGASDERKRRANKAVLNCFVRYQHLANLDVLAGSALTPNDIDSLNITHEHYRKLLEIIEGHYDIVIMDLNSSVTHATTYEMMRMSKVIFCIINLDYNNILNASRYTQTIRNFQVEDKLRYVLNQDIRNSSGKFGTDLEELSFTAENVEEKIFHLCARIPNIEPSVFFNRQFEGIPIVLHKRSYTAGPRLALLKLAQEICEIDPDVIRKLEEKQNGEKTSFFSSLFRSKKKKEPKPEPEKTNLSPGIPIPQKDGGQDAEPETEHPARA